MARNLRVERHELDPDLLILQTTERHKFLDIQAGIGLPSGGGEAQHCTLSVVGLMQDLTVLRIEERQGTVDDIFTETVNAKDRLLLSAVWIDQRETETYRYFSRGDGLRHYHTKGKDAKGRTIYRTRAEHWPFYRDRDTTTRIRALPAQVASQPLVLYERIRSLQNEGIFAELEGLTWWIHLQRLPQDHAIRHPRLFAIGAAVYGILKARTRAQEKKDAE